MPIDASAFVESRGIGVAVAGFSANAWIRESIPIDMMMGPFQRQLLERIMASNPDFPAEARAMVENMNVGAVATAFKLVFSVIIGLVFGMLGGLLGVALFKKKDMPPPPPGTVEVLPPA